MDITINLTRIKLMDEMIFHQSTGSPNEFARKLGVKSATLYNYLRLLKSLGIPIGYNFIRQTYYYKREGRIAFHFYEK